MSTTTSNGFDKDAEKNLGQAEAGNGPEWDNSSVVKLPWRKRFVDSFKRDPNAHVTKPAQLGTNTKGGFDHLAAAERTANSGLAHKLKARHMQMIAIGGSIGEYFWAAQTAIWP